MPITQDEKSGLWTDKAEPTFGYYRSEKEAKDAAAQRAGKRVPKSTPEEIAEANKAAEPKEKDAK